jgi:rhodanese-related sulfurtransferase
MLLKNSGISTNKIEMKLIKEIIVILIGSAIIAILFNFNQSKPIPLIKSEKIILPISDSILFGNEPNSLIETKSNVANIEVKKTTTDSNKTKNAIQINSKFQNQNITENKTGSTQKANQEMTKPAPNIVSETKNNLEKTITYNQLLKILNDPKFLLIDARHTENYLKAKIGNSINIFPYGDEKEMMGKILDLPRDKTLIIYCDGGNCDASHELAKIILGFGYEKVFIFTGGWEEWTKKQGMKE